MTFRPKKRPPKKVESRGFDTRTPSGLGLVMGETLCTPGTTLIQVFRTTLEMGTGAGRYLTQTLAYTGQPVGPVPNGGGQWSKK